MSTTNTTDPIKPKYDSNYNVEHTVQGIRFIGEVLAEIVKERENVDLTKLPELFENSKDLLLYTLGWLEPRKDSTSPRISNCVRELTKGIEALVREGDRAGKTPGVDLSDIAITYLEFALALEECAKHLTGNGGGAS